MIEPLFLKGTVKDYIWGGNKLEKLFGKNPPIGSVNIAESWELSCNPDGQSIIFGGDCDGISLLEYIEQKGSENVLGKLCKNVESVPIIKLIDAREALSIQVHPSDEYARSKGFKNGKSEMWYVIDAEEGAEIVYGVNKELSREEFRQHIENETLEEILNFVPVKKGDVFYIPAGTLHAIGKGILIAEVQQNSNLTYRVYDYNRLGADGQKRELHTEDAIACTSLVPTDMKQKCNLDYLEYPCGSSRILCACDYFVTSLNCINGTLKCSTGDVYRHLLILDGTGILEYQDIIYTIKKGDSILLPSSNNNVDYCIQGQLEYLSVLSVDAEE